MSHNLHMGSLTGKVAVVTGGTFGVGRGIAGVLAQAAAKVFVTSRSVRAGVSSGTGITGIRCDHRLDEDVKSAFARVVHGVSKAATDKMTADTAVEFRRHGVSVVSLYPRLVRTEYGFTDLDGRTPRALTRADV